MLFGVILGLLVGWLISFFGGDQLLIQGIRELMGLEIAISGYYTIFAIIGLLGGILNDRR